MRTLRKMILVAAASIFRRHIWAYSQLPWALIPVADNRIPLATRRRLAVDLYGDKNTCCVTPGMCRQMKERGVSVDDLFTPKWQSIFVWLAQLLRMQIYDLEFSGQNIKTTPIPKNFKRLFPFVLM
eukprot:2640474-Heterocapsa_arctica.AAC.1